MVAELPLRPATTASGTGLPRQAGEPALSGRVDPMNMPLPEHVTVHRLERLVPAVEAGNLEPTADLSAPDCHR